MYPIDKRETDFDLILDSSQALIPLDKELIAIRIMRHLNPSISDKGHLLPLVGRTFCLGGDRYKIVMTEGVVGYPERMAQMATAKLVKE